MKNVNKNYAKYSVFYKESRPVLGGSIFFGANNKRGYSCNLKWGVLLYKLLLFIPYVRMREHKFSDGQDKKYISQDKKGIKKILIVC